MISSLTIRATVLDEMTRFVAEHAPLEACGLLAGKADRAEVMLGVTNQAQSEVRFVMDPYEQLRAFDWIDAQGLNLVAIFHSHPAGPATASPTDIAEAAYAVVHIVLSPVAEHWQARGFWIADGQAREVALQIVE